jgi:hypothetical protein
LIAPVRVSSVLLFLNDNICLHKDQRCQSRSKGAVRSAPPTRNAVSFFGQRGLDVWCVKLVYLLFFNQAASFPLLSFHSVTREYLKGLRVSFPAKCRRQRSRAALKAAGKFLLSPWLGSVMKLQGVSLFAGRWRGPQLPLATQACTRQSLRAATSTGSGLMPD